jgi:integrase
MQQLIRLKHIKVVQKRLADGSTKVFRYHRRTGKKIDGEPGTPEFLRSYEAASRSAIRADTDTLASLIRRYKRASEFSHLAPRTREDYDAHLAAIEREWGDMPLEAIDDKRIRPDIKEWRDRLAVRSKRQADYFLAVLSLVLSFGVDSGLIENNHAKGIRKLYKASRAELIWLPDQIALFESVASFELQIALTLALHTGQREGDLLRLPWSAYDGKAITFRQGKTGAKVYVPCTKALKIALDSAPRRSVTVLTNTRGRSWTEDGFRASWYKTSRKAGILGLTFNDLRGTAVTMLSEAGCTTQEIATITGHALKNVSQILEHYLARTRHFAEAAILKLENARATKVTNKVTTARSRSSV